MVADRQGEDHTEPLVELQAGEIKPEREQETDKKDRVENPEPFTVKVFKHKR